MNDTKKKVKKYSLRDYTGVISNNPSKEQCHIHKSALKKIVKYELDINVYNFEN